MNKLEANISLFIITFFAAIQYPFLSGVPDTVSHFSFLCITNLIGFVLTLALFFSELFRVDKNQIKQSLYLSGLLFGFNVFLLLGSAGVSSTTSACVLSSYFVFIPVLGFLLFRQKPDRNSIAATAIVFVGLFFMMNADAKSLLDVHVLYLAIADVFFALYIMAAGKFTVGSNPSILAMGQMLFNFLISLLFWGGESLILSRQMTLPADASFWGSVIFVSLFIRGLYGIVQIYAQRYSSPLNTSLIFSTEILMTMVMSPVLAMLFGTDPEEITAYKVVGGILMVIGILVADSTVTNAIKRRFVCEKA